MYLKQRQLFREERSCRILMTQTNLCLSVVPVIRVIVRVLINNGVRENSLFRLFRWLLVHCPPVSIFLPSLLPPYIHVECNSLLLDS